MNDRQTELKEHSAHIFEMGCMEQRVYLKNDADAVIEAKDAEIAELKERYKDMDTAHTVHIAKMNAKIEELESNERRLKRALYIVHAYKAKFKRWWLHLALDCESSNIRQDVITIKRIKRKIEECFKSERKCKAKAEEYK